MFGPERLNTCPGTVIAVPALFAFALIDCCFELENLGSEQSSLRIPQPAFGLEKASYPP